MKRVDMGSTLLRAKPQETLAELSVLCTFLGEDGAAIARDSRVRLREYQTKKFCGECMPCRMEAKWYASLESGKPDFTIYDGPAYAVEAWLSWMVHPREFLAGSRVYKPRAQLFSTAWDYLRGEMNTVADLGCGIAFSTAALKEMMPDADVYGTNLSDTLQTRVGREMAYRFGFSVEEVPRKADLVVASEYFEHFDEPIVHLREVLDATQPKALLIGNAFGVTAPGHFPEYIVDGVPSTPAKTSRAFGTEMRAHGYSKVDAGYWNRPLFWVRNDEKEKV